jgi:hypothetical protein
MEITVQYLREWAALYRQKAATTTKPIDRNRYRDFAELLDGQAAFIEKRAADREQTHPINSC